MPPNNSIPFLKETNSTTRFLEELIANLSNLINKGNKESIILGLEAYTRTLIERGEHLYLPAIIVEVQKRLDKGRTVEFKEKRSDNNIVTYTLRIRYPKNHQ